MPIIKSQLQYRLARNEDLAALTTIENACFDSDRLSSRSFRRWLKAEHGILLVVERETELAFDIVAYGLVWCHKGTRLARLYSLAVMAAMRGQGVAEQLLQQLEMLTAEQGYLFMRLEVAKSNISAIRLYEKSAYRIFGEHSDYYQDHSDALRMQKRIRSLTSDKIHNVTPWYQQTTEFTCGPAALMMAMASLDKCVDIGQSLELDIWREATTIFMTSGHGGCHPIGLALAAQQRQFKASVYLNTDQALFVDGVRSEAKREIMRLVHQQFLERAQVRGVSVCYQEITPLDIYQWLNQYFAVLVLISTYRLDGKKTPHWVTVTGIDERCIYVHDPDPEKQTQRAIDCQYLPIAREDFEKMSSFGTERLRTAVTLELKK
ncbi:MAG: ribosomal protein S18 acetylase RimI-like enzyme [Cellvibrionaceae bacterium]|jgi:ribosomal protein S18 acetylase RimI-like enzyme